MSRSISTFTISLVLACSMSALLGACDSNDKDKAKDASASKGKEVAPPALSWHSIDALGIQLEFPEDGEATDAGGGATYLSRAGAGESGSCQIKVAKVPLPMELDMRVKQLEASKKPNIVLKEISAQTPLADGWHLEYSFINHRDKTMLEVNVQREIGETVVYCEGTHSDAEDAACAAKACLSLKAN